MTYEQGFEAGWTSAADLLPPTDADVAFIRNLLGMDNPTSTTERKLAA